MLDAMTALPAELDSGPVEMAVLGALLMAPKTMLAVLPAGFSDAVFGYSDNAEVFRAIQALGDDASMFRIAPMLAGKIEGAQSFLAEIVSNRALSMSVDTVRSYAHHIVTLHQKRQIIALADELRARLVDEPETTVEAMVGMSAARLDGIQAGASNHRPTVSLMQAADAAINAAERAMRGEVTGIRTCFDTIDQYLGSLEGGAVYVLAARPAMGKTALGAQIALNVAEQGLGVGFISLEMQAAQIGRRMLSFRSGVPVGSIKRGLLSQAQIDNLVGLRNSFGKLPMSIEDQSGLNMPQIAAKARAIHRRHGLKLLVIDHMHIVAEPEGVAKNGPTWAVKQVSNGIKRLAKDLDIPILALAQLSRGPESREDKRPTMADLRQSGEIEQDAEAIMMLYRHEYYLGKSPPERMPNMTESAHATAVEAWHDAKAKHAGRASLSFEKVRDGAPGSIELGFDGPLTAFHELVNE